MTDEITHYGGSKVEHYKWGCRDEPGEFLMIDKSLLKIDREHYQRNYDPAKVLKIASDWSWVACGTITVSQRKDGTFWVIEGQHRVYAARKRSDIKLLPCMVFRVEAVETEAAGFLGANTLRKPLSGIDRFRAKVTVGDRDTAAALRIVERHGYHITSNSGELRGVKAVSQIERMTAQDDDAFDAVMGLFDQCFGGAHFLWDTAAGLHYLHSKKHVDLREPRTRTAIRSLGLDALNNAAAKGAAYYGSRNPVSWADGITKLLNRGRRSPISTYSKDAA
jgi:hypothetical protein